MNTGETTKTTLAKSNAHFENSGLGKFALKEQRTLVKFASSAEVL